MNKPKPIESRPYYDLISVLKYVDNKIPRFHKKRCGDYYVKWDT